MLVYGHPLSSCTRKVLIILAEKGEEATLIPVDLFTHENRKEPHLSRHPFGVVPVLDDDGFVLFESRAIIRYLDARLGGPPLTPSGARDVARMDQWLSVDQSYVAPHTRTLAVERILKPRAGEPANGAAVDAAEDGLRTAFVAIDKALEDNPYLVGVSLSLADISLSPYVASLPMIGAAHVLEGLPHLRRWWAAIRERPSAQRAFA